MNSFFTLWRSLFFAFFLFPFSFFPSPLHADTSDPDLDAANRAYTYGSYDEAAKLFQQIITARGYSAPLCFNLANAEARAGHPGLAILNYERARYLAPGDPDIEHNLQLARKQAGLDPNSYRWWEIVLRSVNPAAGYLIMFCLAALLLALIGHTWLSAQKITAPGLRLLFKTIFFVGIPVTLFLGFIELSAVGFTHRIEGVVVAKDASLFLSPFDSAEKIGTVPEGELVTVEERHNDYIYIEGRDKHYGWIQQKQLEPVIAGSFDAP